MFSQKKVFLIFRENGTLIFQKGTFQAHKKKKPCSKKISYTLGNGTF